MADMPIIGIFGADPRQIGASTLRAPLERVIVHALRRQRIMAVALDLIAQWADHLGMAEVATFAHIDIAAGQFQRRIRANAIHHLDGALQIEQRRDLDQATDRDDPEDTRDEDDRVLLENGVSVPERHAASYSAGWSNAAACASSASVALTVIQRLKAMISAPIRNSAPPAARMT